LRTRANLLADPSGSVLVETSIAYMLGMAMILGIIELAMMCYTFGVVSEAARAGVHYASIHGTDSSNCSGPTTGCGDLTAAHVVTQVTAFAATFTKSATPMTVTVTYPDAGGSTAPSRVEVAVSYTYHPLFGISAIGHVFHVAEQGRIAY
jgi:Flp pilus assembly protein TadG